MKESGSVQVIILYYKEFEYFQLALTSVLTQDYADFSVLIIDDGTKEERLLNYIVSLKDPRITFKQNETNLGLSRNFELARVTATATHLVFLGQDDLLEPNFISSILPWVDKNDSIAIAQPLIKIIDESGNNYLPITDLAKKILHAFAWLIGRKATLNGMNGSILNSQKAALLLLVGDFLYFPTLVWRSSFMNEFDTSRSVTLDYLMIMDVLNKKGELLLVSTQCAKYRRHSRSASMLPEKMVDRILEERTFHLGMKNHDLIQNSKILKIVNTLRITQRVHALQVILKLLFDLDWVNSKRALESIR